MTKQTGWCRPHRYRGGTEYYGYAPDNKRIYRLTASGKEEWTFYGAQGEMLLTNFQLAGPYEVWNSQGTQQTGWNFQFQGGTSYVWFAGKMIGVYQDRLGTDRAGGARYYPYGEEITATSNDRVKFATYTRDSFTGLDYADQRFYASTYGRFNTPDPVRNSAAVQVPGSWNRYAYVYGDPVNRMDPSGLTSCDANGDNCYDSVDVTDDEDGDYDGDFDIDYSAQRTGGAPGPPKLLQISNLQKSGTKYDSVVKTLNKIVGSIDPDCQSFLQSGGNNLQNYVSDLLSNNLLAVGNTIASIGAITNTGGTNLAPGTAAIVVNGQSAFFSSNLTVDQGKLQGGTSIADAFILLHELGHALEAQGFKNDGPSAPNSKQAGIDNDNAIDQHCQKTLNGFK